MLRKITADSLQTYLAEVRHKSLLTPTEETALGRRIRSGDEEALGALIEGNLRFVVQVALHQRRYGLPLADLINEGNLGLMHAARKFDPERGTRFITYAVWWIRQAMMHALAEGGGAVRLPIKQAETLAKLRQQYATMRRTLGRDPTSEELAQALALSLEELETLLRVYRPTLSLDAPLQDDSRTTQLDVLQSNTLPSSEEVFFDAVMVREVHDLLQHLEPREAAILRARFGFDGPSKSLAAIGRELGLSRERVRQLETRARAKLRALAKDKALNHYLN